MNLFSHFFHVNMLNIYWFHLLKCNELFFFVIYNVRVNDKCLDLRLLVGQKKSNLNTSP